MNPVEARPLDADAFEQHVLCVVNLDPGRSAPDRHVPDDDVVGGHHDPAAHHRAALADKTLRAIERQSGVRLLRKG